MGGVSNTKCDIAWHSFKGRTLITNVYFDGRVVFDIYKGVNLMTPQIKKYVEDMEGDIKYAKLEDIQ